jgi:alkyl sulfatase BDS1-like metallo-beta-lactamase superfamily hydrolase
LQARPPFSDRADYDDAARGFIATVENARILNENSRAVWTLEPYGFLNEKNAPPDTINPSLFRQADLYMGKKINLDSLISRTFKLEEINEGFEQLRTGGVARGVIVFD